MLWTLFTNRHVILNCVWYSFFSSFSWYLYVRVYGEGVFPFCLFFPLCITTFFPGFLFAVIACGCCSFSYMPAIETVTSLYLTSSIGKQSHAL